MKALNGNQIAALIFGAFLVTGCGSGNTKQLSTAPNGFTPSSTTSALTSQTQQAIFGNYGGILASTSYGSSLDQQGYTLTLGQASIGGNSTTYVDMILSSPYGTAFDQINDEELLDFNQGGQGTFAGANRYVFYTTPHIITNLSNTPVQLEIDIYLNSANQVDSSQSQIVIYDCGYGNSCSTYSTYSQAQFLTFAKR